MTTPHVTLHDGVIDAILAECGKAGTSDETGGILVGHDHEHSIQVTLAGGPGPKAQRSPTRFLRDLDHAQTLADQAWGLDQSQWIGEWHTHPYGSAQPSQTDLSTYLRHLRDPELAFRRFLSVIVATGADGPLHIAAWIVTPTVCVATSMSVHAVDH